MFRPTSWVIELCGRRVVVDTEWVGFAARAVQSLWQTKLPKPVSLSIAPSILIKALPPDGGKAHDSQGAST
jgi:hypothetical protein